MPRTAPRETSRYHTAALLLLLFGTGCRSVNTLESTGAPGSISVNQPPVEDQGSTGNGILTPEHSVSLAVSARSFQASYRRNSLSREGFWEVEFLNTEEEDRALVLRLMRGADIRGTPLWLGVGLAAYGVTYHASKEELFALAITGNARYHFATNPPTLASLEVSAAPQATSFKDGERLLDLSLLWEAQLSGNATFFVGGRYFDAQTESDDKFVNELLLGLRLGI
jgi:hypothetical protein